MVGKRNGRVFLHIVCCVAWATAAAVHAQVGQRATDEPAADGIDRKTRLHLASDDSAAPAALAEVVVTAQKRATLAETLPATLSTVDEQTMKQLEVRSFSQLNALIPGFNFEKTQGGNQVISIRGVGTTSAGQSLEQSVSAYINGVYMGGNLREFATPLYDLAQIEVLKGTQSGISGQNTSVGAINIVTQGPGDVLGGYIRGGHEFQFDGWNAEGAVDLPVSNTLKVRVAGLYEDVGGWVRNIRTGNDAGGTKTKSGRLNAVWLASDSVTVKLYGQYDRGDSLGSTVIPFDNPGSPVYSLFIPGFESSNSTSSQFSSRGVKGGDQSYNYDNVRGSLTVDVNLGRSVLTSVTAASRIHDRLSVDDDISPLDLSWLAQVTQYRQFHQEIRLVSPAEDRFNYIVGAWYRHSDQDKQIDFYLDNNPVHFLANIPFLQKTDTASVYGDLHYALTDKLTIGGTTRYTSERKDGQIEVASNWPVTFLPYPRTRGRLSPSFVDGGVSLRYTPTDTSMLYALYSHGTKTGAFLDLADSLVALKPEKADTYEVGAKLRQPGAGLTSNLSVFRMNITDYQDVYAIEANGITSFAAQNRNLHTQGIEFQETWNATRHLLFGLAGTLMDSQDATGGQAARVPHVSLSGNARYEIPLAHADQLTIFGNVSHISRYLNDVVAVQPSYTRTPGYTLLDAGLEFAQHGGFSASFLVQNLTNTHAYVTVNVSPIDPTTPIGALLPLRRYSLSLNYNF